MHLIKRYSLSFLFLFASSAFSSETTNRGWDVGLRTGVLFGTLVQTEPGLDADDQPVAVSTPYSYGGLPLGFSFSFAPARWLTISPGALFVIDGKTANLTRKGIDVNGEFHLVGEARGTEGPTGEATTHTVSLLTRVGLQGYSASPRLDPDRAVEGVTLETSVGAGYRLALGKKSSLSLSVLRTLFTQSFSAARLSSKLFSAELGWRFFL